MRRNKKIDYLLLLLLLVVGLSVGYALLQTTLTINGTSKIKGNTWDIHFANLNVTDGSVSIGTGDSAAAIQASTTDVTYTVTLNEPGDFYEFTVDAVNAGSIDGMIESVTSKLNNAPITTLPNYLNYSVTYSDGVAISPNQYLKAGESEKYKVRIEFKKDISSSDLPTTVQTLTLNFGVVYVQADENAITRAKSFATDDWETVINTLKTGNISPYEVGDEKEVDLGTFGVRKLRIANSTTPAECSTEGFSQTACGIVLEFSDVIATQRMNPPGEYNGITYDHGWNVDGWPASSMREYVNNDIYNALPTVIKDAIINTTVVSGHGSTAGETNFTSIDKLYLLSKHEIMIDIDGDTERGADYYDTAYHNTRQLDYYANLGITMGNWNYDTSSFDGNYSGAIKKLDSSNAYWWLRSAYSREESCFGTVSDNGSSGDIYASYNSGVSPAFRIG